MDEKTCNIIQIAIVFLLIIGLLIFKFIPEYKATKGSSDGFFTGDKYDDFVEINVNNKLNFGLIIIDKRINHILFFSNDAGCLYNQNIEGMDINQGLEKIVNILIANNHLVENSFVTFVKYNGNSYDIVKNSFLNNLVGLNITIDEDMNTLKNKALDFGISKDDEISILRLLDIYSKNIVGLDNDLKDGNSLEIESEEVKSYADNVYKKIENYVSNNNVINQNVSDSTLPITLIPADSEGKIFPNSSSWYYVENGKVYAYIGFDITSAYGYCYEGKLEVYKKGQC